MGFPVLHYDQNKNVLRVEKIYFFQEINQLGLKIAF